MRTIAMYLPQFHRIPENDQWWGEGFTEWTTVQKAGPLFEGHAQPKIPWNDNYYNLLDPCVMEWQASLAEKYGIDGFCFYHYFFKNGRKILEQPAEKLLDCKHIGMNFCFCWANETWARTWSNIGDKNSWGEKFETNGDISETGILLEQDYGQEELWTEHFYYLLPFFKDKRYITLNGRPVFLLYKPEKIYCLQRMVEVWEALSDKEAVPKVYFIGVNMNRTRYGIDGVLLQGPSAYRDMELCYCKVESKRKSGVLVEPYAAVCQAGLNARKVPGIKTYFGAFTGFDDTPRRAKNGLCLEGNTPELFEEFFYQTLQKNSAYNNELVFINAWNEWGEGMNLEPDKEYGFQYLEAVRSALNRQEKANGKVMENGNGEPDAKQHELEIERELNARLSKYRRYYELSGQWLRLKEQGKSLVLFFERHKYYNIAVYGYGDFGKHLFWELKGSSFEVKYIIDRNKYVGKTVLSLEEFVQKADDVSVIVVTAICEFDVIYHELKRAWGLDCPVISLEEVIFA